MRKSLFLYLFIIAALMNVFTYKYFAVKNATEMQLTTDSNIRLKDSVTLLKNDLQDANVFSLENNDRAQNYLNQNDLKLFQDRVKQALLAYNDDPEGNKYTDQPKMGDQKYIINSIKLLNHRWIIANYSNGQIWGEVLIKYFINEDQTVSFQTMDTYLYPKELN
jgi:hypothetical protein